MDLIDVADRAAALSDLDHQARGRVELEQNFGEADAVLVIAVLESRTPLPTGILDDIGALVADWPNGDVRSMLLDAIARQR